MSKNISVTLEGQLYSIHKKPDYADKKTGEIRPGKHAITLIQGNSLPNGQTENTLIVATLQDNKLAEYKDKVGKKVQVRCGLISDSSVNFYVV